MNTPSFIKSIQDKLVSHRDDIAPFRDWYFVLIMGALLVAVSLVVNVSLFFSTVEEQKTFVPEATPEQSDEEALNATEQAFIERTLERERFETDYQFVDPSL